MSPEADESFSTILERGRESPAGLSGAEKMAADGRLAADGVKSLNERETSERRKIFF